MLKLFCGASKGFMNALRLPTVVFVATEGRNALQQIVQIHLGVLEANVINSLAEY